MNNQNSRTSEKLSAILNSAANQLDTASTLRWIAEASAHLLEKTRTKKPG